MTLDGTLEGLATPTARRRVGFRGVAGLAPVVAHCVAVTFAIVAIAAMTMTRGAWAESGQAQSSTAPAAEATTTQSDTAKLGSTPQRATSPTTDFNPQPHKEAKLRGVLAAAWQDATTTWSKLIDRRTYDNDLPQINFVATVRPSHCYGLYVGAGPVYCSGNNTVFVSLAEMKRLAITLRQGDGTGLAILVAHELGHHVQKVTGRFRVLGAMMRANPRLQRELAVRFELEADCLAGVWAANSHGYAGADRVRSEMASALSSIGDDTLQIAARGEADPKRFTHGTSEQRLRWFNVGLDGGAVSACDTLERDAY